MTYPVVVFCYDRLDMLSKTIDSLVKNKLASETSIYIFSDGAKGPLDKNNVKQVRQYLKTITGFQRVMIVERECNYGLAINIVSGVTAVLADHEAVIVLEDDIITAPYFLDFMNDALNMYCDDSNVCQISGYSFLESYNDQFNLGDTYFIRGADCLAWATWRRAWSSYRSDSANLCSDIVKNNLVDSINRGGAYNYMKMLQNNVRGITNSWAVNWLTHNIIEDRYALFPLKSFALHIGVDDRATNYSFGGPDALDVYVCQDRVDLRKISVIEKKNTTLAYNAFLRSLRGTFSSRVASKLKLFFRKRL